MLLRAKRDEIDVDSLHDAVTATAEKRGSITKMADYESVLSEVRKSSIMHGIWNSYISASPYVSGLDFEDALDSILELARLSRLAKLG